MATTPPLMPMPMATAMATPVKARTQSLLLPCLQLPLLRQLVATLHRCLRLLLCLSLRLHSLLRR
jgi:hypothetical protein